MPSLEEGELKVLTWPILKPLDSVETPEVVPVEEAVVAVVPVDEGLALVLVLPNVKPLDMVVVPLVMVPEPLPVVDEESLPRSVGLATELVEPSDLKLDEPKEDDFIYVTVP